MLKHLKDISVKRILRLMLSPLIWIVLKYYSIFHFPILLRDKTTDKIAFRNIFLFGELKLSVKIEPRFILDCGAYTGLSSIYFSLKYPNAKILAVEPEESNFETLKKNIRGYKNIVPINAAIWPKKTFLKFLNPNNKKWGFRVKEVTKKDNYDTMSVTIDYLLKKYNFDRIDILKLDIEGSERELFSNNYNSWIDKVNTIIIEFHEDIKKGCVDALYSTIDLTEWREYKKGEKVILVRKTQIV